MFSGLSRLGEDPRLKLWLLLIDIVSPLVEHSENLGSGGKTGLRHSAELIQVFHAQSTIFPLVHVINLSTDETVS